MRNPPWHRDELILTLNHYFNNDPSTFDKSNPKIIELSKILNKLPIHSVELRKIDFRNVNGVAMKLGNFTAIDSSNPSKGLTSYSQLDEKVFYEFHNNLDDLKRIAELIIESTAKPAIIEDLNSIENDIDDFLYEGYEGQIVYKLHKVRERNKKLVALKKSIVLKETGRLRCEICDMDFYEKYGEIGKGFIECHHTVQLASYETNQVTKIDDLALVCSNCHRMLHRDLYNLSIIKLREYLQFELQNPTINKCV